MKKILSHILLCAAVFSTAVLPNAMGFAVAETTDVLENTAITTSNYDIWSAPYTEKILRETTINYDAYKSAPGVELDMARAETETSQIVITAKKTIESYNLTVSDLTNSNGDVIESENIQAYSAMYVYVSYLYDSVRNFPKGYFPDAMLPIEKTVEFEENFVPANVNQSIYVSVTSLWNQPAGKYTGTFVLTIDGKNYDIPVSVNVRDCMVSTAVTSKSIFSDNWTHALGELDATQRMTDNYHKALMKYRLCPSWIVDDKKETEADAEYLAQKVWEMYEYGSNEELFGEGADRFTNFTLPLGFNSTGDATVKAALMFLNKFVELSCEKGVDFVERAYFYCVDEPEANNNFNGQKAAHEMFVKVKTNLVSNIEANKTSLMDRYGVSEEFVNGLLESANNLHDIVTQSYIEKYDGYIDTWCPTFDSYDSPYDIQKYKEQNDERWWYGCVVPLAPYPTFHVSDIMLSPRVLGWLQSYYGVTGNLYWSVDQWAGYHILPGEGRAYRFSDNYYTEAGPYDNVAGEGYLFRPGKRYGIDGPIPTIRIDAIRDGLEEYEMMESIKEIYSATARMEHRNWSADTMFAELLSPLASGMQVGATSSAFAKSRKTLLELFELAEQGVCLTDYQDNGKGKVTYKLYVPEGASVTASVGTMTNSDKLTDGTLYTYVVDMQTASALEVTFSITVEGKSYLLTMALPGQVIVINAETLTGNLTGDVTEDGIKVVSAADIFAGAEGNWVELTLKAIDAADSYGYQYVRLTSDVLKQINVSMSKAVFNFYNEGEKIPFKLYAKYENNRSIFGEYTGYLSSGKNEIVWANLNTKSWKYGDIEFLEFCFDDQITGTALPSRKVYFEGMSLYSA